MRGIYDYIIEVEKENNETFTTESGLELHANRRFSQRLVANRIATVINTPAKEETILKPGYQVMFDPTITHRPLYDYGEVDSPYLVNKAKKWYKTKGNLIALYREDEKAEWKAFGSSLMVELVKEEEKKVTSSIIFIPESTTEKYKKGHAKVVYPSLECIENNVQSGDEIYLKPNKFAGTDEVGVSFTVEGKHLKWVRNIDVVGKIINN